MNAEAFEKTQKEGKVTFWSRSKERLWTKGETSDNYFVAENIIMDCDQDSLLIKAIPQGPTCHTGADTCFNESNSSRTGFIDQLRTDYTGPERQILQINPILPACFRRY